MSKSSRAGHHKSTERNRKKQSVPRPRPVIRRKCVICGFPLYSRKAAADATAAG